MTPRWYYRRRRWPRLFSLPVILLTGLCVWSFWRIGLSQRRSGQWQLDAGWVQAAPLEEVRSIRACTRCGSDPSTPFVEFIRVPYAATDPIIKEMAPWMCGPLGETEVGPERCPLVPKQFWWSWRLSWILKGTEEASKPLIQTQWPATQLQSTRAFKAIMFRDPTIRFLAEYETERRIIDRRSNISLKTWGEMDERKFEKRYKDMFNRQTRTLLGERLFAELGLTPTSKQLSVESLRTIRRLLETIHFVGISENVALSLCLFSGTFVDSSSSLSEYCASLTLGEGSEELSQVTNPYDFKAYSRVAKYNLLDEMVYGIARSIFFDRVAALRGCHPLWAHQCKSEEYAREEYNWTERVYRSEQEDETIYLERDKVSSKLRGHPAHVYAPLSAAMEYKECPGCGGEHRLFQSLVHIPQCAGIAFDSIASSEVCANITMIHRRDFCLDSPTSDQREDVLDGRFPLVHAASPAGDITGSNVVKGMFLRDPIRRIVSGHESNLRTLTSSIRSETRRLGSPLNLSL